MARYRKIDPRIWNDEKFMSLSHEGQRMFLFVLTHPAMTGLGAFRMSREGLKEELGLDSKGFTEPFQQLLDNGLVKYDERAFLIFAPNFLRYNPPENPNVIKGWSGVIEAREGGYGLFFYGNPGTGKSHLAISIIKALLPQAAGLYTRVPDMIGYIRAQWHADSETSSYAAIRRYVDLDLLVLDELGVQSGSINEQTLLFEVIDARLSENRPTIFLSNLAPADLVSIIGERLIDRIKGKCVAQRFTGESRRKPLTADIFGQAA